MIPSPEQLPHTETLEFDKASDVGGIDLEFRLLYDGPLHATTTRNSRVEEKHKIRKIFHMQLAELWQQHPLLRPQTTEPVFIRRKSDNDEYDPGGLHVIKVNVAVGPKRSWKKLNIPIVGQLPDEEKPFVEHLADIYSRCGYRFVPLVRKDSGLTCSLEILFLRRDSPGGLIVSGGDIDNRLKTLFDAFRMPENKSQISGPPESYEDPFFCLLEDDSLITGVSMTTDRLLLPLSGSQRKEDVHLVIVVKTKVVNPNVIYASDHLL